MTTVLILLILFSLIMLIAGVASIYVAYRALRGYFEISEQNDEYHRFMDLVFDQITESSELFRVELARRISMNISEYRELNSQLHELETKMQAAKLALKEFLSEE